MDALGVTAVGASEQALRISAAGTTIPDHRARLAPTDIFFFLPFGLIPLFFVTERRMSRVVPVVFGA
jgi:hypothetical protein